MRPLFEIQDDLLLAIANTDDDGEMDEAASKFLDGLLQEEGKKLDNYVNLIRMLEGDARTARDEADKYAQQAKSRENKVSRLKTRLLEHLEATGRTSVKTETARTIRVQANGGVVPLEIEVEADKLPEKYQRVTVTPNKEELRADLESGVAIPGVRLGERGKQLRIN